MRMDGFGNCSRRQEIDPGCQDELAPCTHYGMASAFFMPCYARNHLSLACPCFQLRHTYFVAVQGYAGVTCVDTDSKALPAHHNPTQFQGFGLKILALYLCSFKHVLVLDSDNLPLISPDVLFNNPVMQKSGNLFFPDYWQREGHEPVKAVAYYAFDLTPPWEKDRQAYMATESGQILLDRCE